MAMYASQMTVATAAMTARRLRSRTMLGEC
jgi:hypothetical protein